MSDECFPTLDCCGDQLVDPASLRPGVNAILQCAAMILSANTLLQSRALTGTFQWYEMVVCKR